MVPSAVLQERDLDVLQERNRLAALQEQNPSAVLQEENRTAAPHRFSSSTDFANHIVFTLASLEATCL